MFKSGHILLSTLHCVDLALGAPSTCSVGADTAPPRPNTPSLCGVMKEGTVTVMVTVMMMMMMLLFQLQLTDCCIEIIASGFRFDPLEEAPRNSCRQNIQECH